MMIYGYSAMATILLTATLSATVTAAPRRGRRSSVPPWHKPCGEALEAATMSDGNFDEEAANELERIALQHRVALNNYLNSDYEYLYDEARYGLAKHLYTPNWIPGKKEVDAVLRLSGANARQITKNLSQFHTDLQKFAVAFEELVKDEQNETIQRTLKATQSYLLMTLCEVESTIFASPYLEVPRRIGRKIMTAEQRDPADDTRRLVRDWGVLLKYKDYLHAWRRVFDY